MKKLFLILLLSTTIFGQVGVGLHSGATTGFSASYWNTEPTFYNVNLSYNFAKEGEAVLFVDYNRLPFVSRVITLPFYYGIGVQLKPFHKKDEEGVIGLRANFGLQAYVYDEFDLFINLSPTFHLVPDSKVEFIFLLGARYYL